jgi:hypothetical protein
VYQVSTTVLQPAKSYDLTTIDAVKDELNEKTSANNDVLKRYISSASAAASQYCNRVFAAEAVSDQFLPVQDPSFVIFSGRAMPLQLSRWPIVSVTSVMENGTALNAATDYMVDPIVGSITRLGVNGNPISWSYCAVTVSYVGGYIKIPLDVDDAIVRMVTRRFVARGRDPNLKQRNVPGILEESYWVSTGTETGNMSNDIADILDNYRVPLVA